MYKLASACDGLYLIWWSFAAKCSWNWATEIRNPYKPLWMISFCPWYSPKSAPATMLHFLEVLPYRNAFPISTEQILRSLFFASITPRRMVSMLTTPEETSSFGGSVKLPPATNQAFQCKSNFTSNMMWYSKHLYSLGRVEGLVIINLLSILFNCLLPQLIIVHCVQMESILDTPRHLDSQFVMLIHPWAHLECLSNGNCFVVRCSIVEHPFPVW